jgi:ABC-type uncharacterized transport system permease subunit
VKTGQTVAVVVAIVCIVVALVAFILGVLAITEPNDQRIDHLGISTLAVFSSAILGLLAFLKANAVQKDLHNGVVEETVERAVRKVLDEQQRKAAP